MLHEAGGRWFNRHFRYAEHVKTSDLHKLNTDLTVHNITIRTRPLMTQCTSSRRSVGYASIHGAWCGHHRAAEESGTPFEMLLEDARHAALLKALTLADRTIDANHGKTLVFTNSAISAESAVLFLEEECMFGPVCECVCV